MRTLWYVPVIHTFDETSASNREAAQVKRTIPLLSAELSRRVRPCWTRVYARLEALRRRGALNMPRVRVYCDGFPYPLTTYHRRVIYRRSNQHLPIFRFATSLQRQGAHICGTEDPLWLEYYALREELAELSNTSDERQERIALRERDRAIAERIAHELHDGHSAILVMGAAHRVDRFLEKLAPDIRIRHIECFRSVIAFRRACMNEIGKRRPR